MENITVGKKIRKAVKDLDLTQEAFGKKIGVIKEQVKNWVNGYSNPSLKSLKKIAETTGKPLSYFTEDSASYSTNTNQKLGQGQNIVEHNNKENVTTNNQLETYCTILGSRLEKIENKLEIHTVKLDLIIEKLKNKKGEK